MSYGDGKCQARIDFMKVEAMDDVDLDDVVTVVVTGKVKSLRGPEKRKSEDYPIEPGGKTKGKPKERLLEIPGTLEIDITEMHIAEANEFDGRKMEEDED
jgi:hypothetical protein